MTTNKIFYIIVAVALLLSGCKKDKDEKAILTTNAASNITATSATLGGNITNAGTPAYTERGVCYATTQEPTADNTKVIVTGAGTGDFSIEVTGLAFNTTYYVRAYAVNTEDTAYGSEVTFKTLHPGEPELVFVQSGTFTMGCTDDQCFNWDFPAHQVTLTKDYYIGKYEVTQAQWKAVMGDNPSYFKGDNLPVECVSWNNIQEFILKLNELTGKKYRLPTEAEWEYAARGGNKSKNYKYSGSNNIDDVAWYGFYTGAGNSGETTNPVGTKQPNELSIYDMSGNVLEWCSDWLEYYTEENQTDPVGPETGSIRVFRGGGWDYYAEDCRVSTRTSCNDPYGSYNFLGFRLVCSSE